MLSLALTFALQVAPQVSLRALLAHAPAAPSGAAAVDVVLDAQGRPFELVLCDAQGRERPADWAHLWGGDGTWHLREPLCGTPPGAALLELAPQPTDRGPYGALFASAPTEELGGVVRSVDHERAHDGREFSSLRVQGASGDLVRVALGPSGWHARGAGLPELGQELRLRAVSTRDERGLVWIAATLRAGEDAELRVRGDDGAPSWPELGVGPCTSSAAALLGRRVLVGGSVVGHVEDLLLQRGTGAPRTTWVIRRSAGGGPSVLVEWGRASVADDGSLTLPAEEWGEARRPAEPVRPRASGTAASGSTRRDEARAGALPASFPGSRAARCRRP